MNLLLDTHAFLWLMLDSARLSEEARAAIRSRDSRVVLSAASAWELAIKESLGKLELPAPAASWVVEACRAGGIETLDIDLDTALAVGSLPWHHRDPFDRLLVAQAMTGFTLVTHDRVFEHYRIAVLWT